MESSELKTFKQRYATTIGTTEGNTNSPRVDNDTADELIDPDQVERPSITTKSLRRDLHPPPKTH